MTSRNAHKAGIYKRQREERIERQRGKANEKLQESLKQAIDSDNKGFQMLAKMGYKQGQCLGKTKNIETPNNDNRLLEPIAINIKADRGGLGREMALKELAEKRAALHRQYMQKLSGVSYVTTDEFRKRVSAKVDERIVEVSLRQCQRTCENIDLQNNVESPYLKWFWPEQIEKQVEKEEEEQKLKTLSADLKHTEEEETYTNSEKLEMLTNYLRTSYLYCFWCGSQYTNENDLNESCPGTTRDDH